MNTNGITVKDDQVFINGVVCEKCAICPDCWGHGGAEYIWYGGGELFQSWDECFTCKGKGLTFCPEHTAVEAHKDTK